MALATVGDIVVARSSAKLFDIACGSRWVISEVTNRMVRLLRHKYERSIELSYKELADHFDLLAQITKLQIIK